MKKMVSFLLGLVLMMSASSPAFAGSEDKSAGSGAVQPSTEVQALEETDEA